MGRRGAAERGLRALAEDGAKRRDREDFIEGGGDARHASATRESKQSTWFWTNDSIRVPTLVPAALILPQSSPSSPARASSVSPSHPPAHSLSGPSSCEDLPLPSPVVHRCTAPDPSTCKSLVGRAVQARFTSVLAALVRILYPTYLRPPISHSSCPILYAGTGVCIQPPA